MDGNSRGEPGSSLRMGTYFPPSSNVQSNEANDVCIHMSFGILELSESGGAPCRRSTNPPQTSRGLLPCFETISGMKSSIALVISDRTLRTKFSFFSSKTSDVQSATMTVRQIRVHENCTRSNPRRSDARGTSDHDGSTCRSSSSSTSR